ncbi:hypothetical protein CP995_18235 [Klebsiella pneumoniae]|nr:hypothetical protein CP995_18235 [Klebsiella pneumoniae]
MCLIIIYAIYFIKFTTTNQIYNNALLYKKIISFAQTSKFNIKNQLRNILKCLTLFIYIFYFK